MKFQEYAELFEELVNKIKDIRAKKSNDYASSEDTLLNFKKLAVKRDCDPAEVVRFFIDVKLQRLDNLAGKDPECESIQDTIIDLINYTGLYYACLVDAQSSTEKEDKKRYFKVLDSQGYDMSMYQPGPYELAQDYGCGIKLWLPYKFYKDGVDTLTFHHQNLEEVK